MKSTKCIEMLGRQRDAATSLTQVDTSSPEFTKWRRDTEIVIERAFGAESRHLQDFKNVRYHLGVFSTSTPDYEFTKAYKRGLEQAAAILSSMIAEIEEFGLGVESVTEAPDALSLIEKLCTRFHRAARQLQHRHDGRTTIAVDDEYDVQDLFHSVLRLHFDDVRAEEWTPSHAGGSSRVDFLLKDERIVVEVKKTRASMRAKELGEQLIIDRARYASHPDCSILVCFVYDPEGRIGNPSGLERDLESHSGTPRMRVIIAPRS